MKHLYKFSLLLLALLLPATALAHDFEVDGIYYKINGTEATVTCKGTYYNSYTDEYSGAVTIPATITYGGTTYSVTSIGDFAFRECTSLTSITIPNSVTSIGYGAFYGCSGLASIQVESGNTTYDSRNNCNAIIETATNSMIVGCMNTVIPNSVTTIGNSAFYNCSGLTSITIPNSVTSIGSSAFSGCSGLTSIDIPNSVITIGYAAFSGCSGLTSINIPNSVTSIGDYAFYGCTGLTSITIPNSVTAIGDQAFDGCSGLTSIDLPESITSIGYNAFCGTPWLNNQPDGLLYIGQVAFKYIGPMPNETSITIREGTISIATEAFQDCSGLTSIYIPNSVTTIGALAFYGCSNLTSIDIPNSVISISGNTFYGTAWYDNQPDGLVYAGLVAYGYKGSMPNETSIILREGTLGIAIGAFSWLGLTSVTIPNSVTYIGDFAFYCCSFLTEIYCLALTPPKVGSNTFDDCYGATLYVPDIALDAYKTTDWNGFANIVGMPYTFEVDGTSYHATTMSTASVMANDNAATLYSGDVVIPDSVTYEGTTFAVTGIESNAFDGCYELTSVIIPNTVESIGKQAFQGCTGLTSVTIGSGVTAIGAKAFNYCNVLETVKCMGTVPPVMASTDCFSTAAYNRATLLVPRNSEATYAAADYWYKFAHIDGWGSAGRGDVNGDGIMNIADVTFMIDAILNGDYENIYFESADLNINGRLDIGDVTTIIDMLLNGN